MDSPGDTIRLARETRGWSQATLASEAQLSASALNRYERNRRPLTMEATHLLARTLTDDHDAYRDLSALLVEATCLHFGRSATEGPHSQSDHENTPTDQEG